MTQEWVAMVNSPLQGTLRAASSAFRNMLLNQAAEGCCSCDRSRAPEAMPMLLAICKATHNCSSCSIADRLVESPYPRKTSHPRAMDPIFMSR